MPLEKQSFWFSGQQFVYTCDLHSNPNLSHLEFERQKRALFEAAVVLDETQRTALLACSDPVLAEAVRRLLTASRDHTDGVLNRPLHERRASAASAPPSVIGKYPVLRHLGTGGMGSVYACKDPQTGAEVAAKIVRSDLTSLAARQHFERERDVLKSLKHPNVCRLLDAGVSSDGAAFIVMEMIHGTRFDAYCRQSHCSVYQSLWLFGQVLAGVGYCHKNNVIHRDLKPSNLLVTPEKKVKILDFGLAKMVEHTKGQTGHGPTSTLFPFMTIRYASPERLSGHLSGRTSDIFSLGVICYELVTGRHLLAKESSRTARLRYEALTTQMPAKPSQIVNTLPASIDDLVMKALHINPQNRYPSAEAFLLQIGKFLDSHSQPHTSSAFHKAKA